MIIAKNLESVFEKHYKDFELMYLKRQNKPITHSGLEYFFTDSSPLNHKWYRFPKAMALPVDRLGMLLKFTQYLAKGLSPEEDEALDQIIEDAIETGIKNNKAKVSAVIATVLEEKKRRRTLCFHTEIFYNYLAVQLIRDDENPVVYDNAIQIEKVEQLKREQPDDGVYFFFHQPELEKLKTLFNITDENLTGLLQSSTEEMQLLKEKISYLKNSLNTIS